VEAGLTKTAVCTFVLAGIKLLGAMVPRVMNTAVTRTVCMFRVFLRDTVSERKETGLPLFLVYLRAVFVHRNIDWRDNCN
jgi:hypothetical protein